MTFSKVIITDDFDQTVYLLKNQTVYLLKNQTVYLPYVLGKIYPSAATAAFLPFHIVKLFSKSFDGSH
jgi:hypothetical protein